MFLPNPQPLNAQALQDALIVSVGKDAIYSEIQRNPGFSLRMLSGISHGFQRLLMDVESYALQNGMQRLAWATSCATCAWTRAPTPAW